MPCRIQNAKLSCYWKTETTPCHCRVHEKSVVLIGLSGSGYREYCTKVASVPRWLTGPYSLGKYSIHLERYTHSVMEHEALTTCATEEAAVISQFYVVV